MRRSLGLGLTVAGIAAVLVMPAPAPQKAEVVDSLSWESPHPRFGGISAIELAADGLGFIAISDSAAFFAGRFTRGARGEVTGAALEPPVLPVSIHGTPLDDWMDDAEGAATTPDGGLLVSYESHNRIVRYSAGGTVWQAESWPEVFKTFAINKGIEALAVDPLGRVLAIPELTPGGGDTPVFHVEGQEASVLFTLRHDRGWSPTGADFGPDGRLYLLERDFWPLLGFASRVRRISLDGDRVIGDEIIWQSEPGHHDNLEGIAAWADADGEVRLTLVSDDNFLPVQKTELVDLRVAE